MQNQAQNKKHGGHLTGFRSDLSKGGGPVFFLRGVLNVGQEDMAERLGCSLSAVRKWEKLGTGPKRGTALHRELERLAAKTGVDLSEGE